MKNLLLTAFEPFGGEKINSSLMTLETLPDVIGEFRIYKLKVPVVFKRSYDTVIRYASEIKPDVILSLGQAKGRDKVTPEYVGINLRNARIPDNDGNQPLRERIAEDGPDAYFTTLPVFDMAEAVRNSGTPCEVSFTAGTYVCNELFYGVLDHFKDTDVRVGFTHLPVTREQADDGCPYMEKDQMVSAIIKLIEAI